MHAPYVTISVINSNIVPSRFLIKPSSIQFFVGAKLGGVCAQLDRIFYSFEVVSPGSPNKQEDKIEEGGKIAKEVEATLAGYQSSTKHPSDSFPALSSSLSAERDAQSIIACRLLLNDKTTPNVRPVSQEG